MQYKEGGSEEMRLMEYKFKGSSYQTIHRRNISCYIHIHQFNIAKKRLNGMSKKLKTYKRVRDTYMAITNMVKATVDGINLCTLKTLKNIFSLT